jgi:hypothetical protein
VVTYLAVNIRKLTLRASRLHDLVELGTLSTQAAVFLDASVRAGLNILVAGGTVLLMATWVCRCGSDERASRWVNRAAISPAVLTCWTPRGRGG